MRKRRTIPAWFRFTLIHIHARFTIKIIPVYTVTGVGTFCVCTASAERMVSLNSFVGDLKVFNYQVHTLVDLTQLPVLHVPEVVGHSLILKVYTTKLGTRARYCLCAYVSVTTISPIDPYCRCATSVRYIQDNTPFVTQTSAPDSCTRFYNH